MPRTNKQPEDDGFWPHQFTKNGEPTQIGEQIWMERTRRPLLAQPMICVHCQVEYIQGKDAQPQGKCPARNTKREMKRILG